MKNPISVLAERWRRWSKVQRGLAVLLAAGITVGGNFLVRGRGWGDSFDGEPTRGPAASAREVLKELFGDDKAGAQGAAAPVPPSHDSRYWMPTLQLARRPASVILPPVLSKAMRSAAFTFTSGRCFSTWLGREPSTASNSAVATSTRSG